MASVTLWINRRENAVYDLPRVCMKCGAEATTVRKKQFSWYPPWVSILILAGFWPYLIVVMILTKRQSVEVPFCDQHKNHWLIRTVIGLLSFGVLLGIGFVGFIVASANAPNNNQNDDMFGFVCGGWFVLLLVWIVAYAIINSLTSIRVTKITDREITLTNVSPEFVRVLQEEEDEYERDLARDVGDRWRDSPRRAHRPDDDRIERGDRRPPRKRSTDISDEE
jgi:hypothetical protein